MCPGKLKRRRRLRSAGRAGRGPLTEMDGRLDRTEHGCRLARLRLELTQLMDSDSAADSRRVSGLGSNDAMSGNVSVCAAGTLGLWIRRTLKRQRKLSGSWIGILIYAFQFFWSPSSFSPVLCPWSGRSPHE